MTEPEEIIKTYFICILPFIILPATRDAAIALLGLPLLFFPLTCLVGLVFGRAAAILSGATLIFTIIITAWQLQPFIG